MTGPTYHARTHLPGGTDPLGDIYPWAYIATNNVTIASGASTVTNIDFPEARFQTSDPGIFEYGLDTFGRTVHTIRLRAGGTYKVFISAQYTGIAAGRSPRVYYDPPLFNGTFQFGNPEVLTNSSIQSEASFQEFVFGDTPTDAFTFPAGGAVFVTNDAAGGFTAAGVSMFIQRLSTQRFPLL